MLGGGFDQAAWCADALRAWHVDSSDVQRTFRYVVSNHPLHGCATAVPPLLNGRETDRELARFADAVTILCCEAVGDDSFGAQPEPALDTPAKLLEINATGVANMAHVAIHHTSPDVRQRAAHALTLWRNAKAPQPPSQPPSQSKSSSLLTPL